VYRIGLGTDIHRLESGRRLVLGGIEIPYERGLQGHSDGDSVLHALGDALLGAAALGDLGQHFPATAENQNRASAEILHEICLMVWSKGYKVVNADIVIMAEEPRLSDYRDGMAQTIANILNVEKNVIGVKATTCDGLGTIGRKESIAAQAVVLLEKKRL
jgi:2-C-methyl-D-erythritol 2,4-cyclodiphosphate synthase